MERRIFLTSLGAAAGSTALAGCFRGSSTPTTENPRTRDNDDQHNAQPLPGRATVYDIITISDELLEVKLHGVRFPREVTLELYVEYPTSETPAGDWTYMTYAPKSNIIRPILTYPEGHATFVSSTKVEPGNGDGYGNEVYQLAHEEMPAGVPLQYQIYIVEHTHGDGDNAPRRHAGTTGPAVRKPGENSYAIISVGSQGPLTFHGREEWDYTEDSEGNHHTTVVASTNNTRFHTPSHDDITNRRPDRVGRGIHERGSFERLWGLDYTVTADEFATAQRHNMVNYRAMFYDDDELRQIRRAFKHYLDGSNDGTQDGDPAETLVAIKRISAQLVEKADLLGFETPEEKLRLAMDFVQWMPYEYDDNRQNEPRVQHPAVTLARGKGDCEDKTLLLASLIYQDPFPDYEMHLYHWQNQSHSAAPHFGLAIKEDIFTVDPGGPVGRNMDNFDWAEEGEWTYIEATYPAALGTANDYTGLVFREMPFPGYD